MLSNAEAQKKKLLVVIKESVYYVSIIAEDFNTDFAQRILLRLSILFHVLFFPSVFHVLFIIQPSF